MLAVERLGSGDRDLVLFHGWGLNRAVWGELPPLLAADYRLHLVDLPGHGQSAAVAADLGLWLEALERVAPPGALLCGWSLGGMLALALHAARADRYAGVLMLSASPHFLARDGWPGIAPGVLKGFGAELSVDLEGVLRRFLALQFMGLGHGRDMVRALYRAMVDAGMASPEALDFGLELLQRLDLRDAFAAQRDSVAVLLGERDRLVPTAVLPHLAEINPEAKLGVVDGAGHAPFLTHGSEVVRFLHEHFNR